MKYIFYIVTFCVLLFSSCQNQVTEPVQRLSFSVDTLLFDTVFTEEGSATERVMLYNRSGRRLTIEQVSWREGSPFRLNLDGESDRSYLKNISLADGDSLFLFVDVHIRPNGEDAPVLYSDPVSFRLANGEEQTIVLEAYGQDVIRIDSAVYWTDQTFHAGKPYVIRHYIASAQGTTLTFDAGATIYLHNGALIQVEGDLQVNGTAEQPVRFLPDRLDDYYIDVPYWYVPGSWSGIYLYGNAANSWQLSHAEIISPVNAVYTYCESASSRATLTMEACRLHNMQQYGIVCQNVDATVSGSEISNAASYCLYLHGGNYLFEDNIIASYYRHTRFNHSSFLYSTPKDDVAAMYVHNLTRTRPTNVRFVHNVLAGTRAQELTIAAPMPQYYSGEFVRNYLACDTLRCPNAHDNLYAQPEDTVFVNNYYDENGYFDFRLDSAFNVLFDELR